MPHHLACPAKIYVTSGEEGASSRRPSSPSAAPDGCTGPDKPSTCKPRGGCTLQTCHAGERPTCSKHRHLIAARPDQPYVVSSQGPRGAALRPLYDMGRATPLRHHALQTSSSRHQGLISASPWSGQRADHLRGASSTPPTSPARTSSPRPAAPRSSCESTGTSSAQTPQATQSRRRWCRTS